MSRMRRVVEFASLALPTDLRRRIGPQVEDLAVARIAQARRHGRLRALVVALICIVDLVWRGVYERLRRRNYRSAAHPRREDFVESLLNDVRHSIRALARAPRFTLVAVATLALGIGANSAIFSVVNGVMLRPLPFPEPDRFVHVAADFGGGAVRSMQYYRVDWLRENTQAFEALASYRSHGGRIESSGRFEAVRGLRVDADFLAAVQFPVAAGRWFTEDESAPGGGSAVVLSHGTWRDRFGADPAALGQTFTVSDRAYTVVGILAPDFAFPQVSGDIQYLVPLGLRPDPTDEGRNYPLVGRLAPGVSAEAAEAELARAWEGFRQAHPDLVGERERGPVLTSYEELHVGGLGQVLWMVMAASAVVLLIACANVANLLLARAAHRQREVTVRAALGATRGRIVRYVLTESLVLALAAGTLGVLLGRWGVDALLGLTPVTLPRVDGVALDLPVLLFSLAATLATGLTFGLTAAWPTVRAGLGTALREGSRGSAGGRRARQSLIMAQAALSVVLLVGAGLLVGTLMNLRDVDAGFSSAGVIAASVPVLAPGYGSPGPVAELVDRVRAEAAAEPGVSGVAAASNLPLERGLNLPVAIAGRPDAYEGAVEWRAASVTYFDVLEIPVRSGRAFSDADVAGAPPVVIVNQSFADHYFPGEPALGQHLEIGRWRGNYLDPSLEVPAAEIVGVVADVRDRSLKQEPTRTIYVPFSQVPAALTSFPVFLGKGPRAAAVSTALRTAIQDADPRLAAADVRALDDVVTRSLALERFNAFLVGSFAALALLLTAFGIYGVIAYAVEQRTREIGIRVAMGARRNEVVGMIVRQGMAPVLVGLVVGALASLWLSRLVTSLVWGIEPNDPFTLAVVAALLLSVAFVASWLPARAATRVDPIQALSTD